MKMLIKCRHCGHIQPSAIQMSPEVFRDTSNQFINNSEQCHNCRAMNPFNAEDYTWEE